MTLEEALRLRYPYEDERLEVRTRVYHLCQSYISRSLGDDSAEQRLCSQEDPVYWQQLSEVLLEDQLAKAQLQPTHPREGPDFLTSHMGRRIWIEVVTPRPEGIPTQWLDRASKVWKLPHEEILLRWTSAIKEKAEKLLGNAERNVKGYLQKGIVRSDDAYVIAVNGYLLRRPSWPELSGISQFPFAVEATFCVGPLQVHIDRETRKVIGSEHQHRPLIPKPNGAQIPADSFLDPRFSPVSAVWAVDIDERLLFERANPMAVVHNPLARNPIPERLLPAQSEYVAIDQGSEYLLETRAGRLSG